MEQKLHNDLLLMLLRVSLKQRKTTRKLHVKFSVSSWCSVTEQCIYIHHREEPWKRIHVDFPGPFEGSMWLIFSLVPRLHPIFQCCTLKNGKAWFAKSRAQHWAWVKLMNVGEVQNRVPQNVTLFFKFK